jgi:hypothetical protein
MGPLDRSYQDRLGAQELHPLGALACTFQLRIGPSLSTPSASAEGLGDCLSLRLRIDRSLNPILAPLRPSAPAKARDGDRRPSDQGSRAPSAAQWARRCQPLMGRDIRGQTPPLASGAQGVWAHSSAYQAGCLHRQEASRRCTWWRMVQADRA